MTPAKVSPMPPKRALSNKDKAEEVIQKDGDTVVKWFSENDMVCSADKTKLLIIGTNQNRISKLERMDRKLKINICNEEKEESTSEKLLGIIVNNTITWKHHIFGDEDNSGLIKDLSKRIGICKQLRKYS